MAFTAAIELMRTPAERKDQALSWARPDRAFFAAGACHVLAFRFLKLHRDRCWELVHVRWRGWDFDRVSFVGTLDQFCAANHHRLPSEYAFDPQPRADAYISQFDPGPPE